MGSEECPQLILTLGSEECPQLILALRQEECPRLDTRFSTCFNLCQKLCYSISSIVLLLFLDKGGRKVKNAEGGAVTVGFMHMLKFCFINYPLFLV